MQQSGIFLTVEALNLIEKLDKAKATPSVAVLETVLCLCSQDKANSDTSAQVGWSYYLLTSAMTKITLLNIYCTHTSKTDSINRWLVILAVATVQTLQLRC